MWEALNAGAISLFILLQETLFSGYVIQEA